MSYILEALKKSQKERELGQVPRLQTSVFDAPLEPTRTRRWIIATFALAALAAVLAIHAWWRPPVANAPDTARGEVEPSGARLASRTQRALGTDAPGIDAPGTEVPEADTPDTDALSSGAKAPPSDTDVVAVEERQSAFGADRDEPRVLVVPAPPKPGERLPRGADELRRAVLGADDMEDAQSAVLASARREPARTETPPAPEQSSLPPDLVAEIEAFKREFRERGGLETAAPAAASSSARPAPLGASLRQQLPPFSMTVHVYADDPVRRFIYLNGRKLREGELTREGFFVEEVLADGAILRYDAHRFFQSP